MTSLGISMARLDSPGSGQYRRDGVFGQLVDSHRVFAARHSAGDSESEDDEHGHFYASGAVQDGPGLTAGAALVYDGDESIVLCQGEGKVGTRSRVRASARQKHFSARCSSKRWRS